MITNLIDKNCAKVLLFLAISPGSNYNRKEIKEKTEIHNVPLDLALNKLLFFGIIKEKKKVYSLNLENYLVKEILKEKVSDLPLKIQIILLETVNNLSKFRLVKNIILFGSYSKLIFTEKSDIDLAIVLKDKIKNKIKIEKSIGNTAEKVSKKYKKEIQIHFFEESDLKNKKDPLIKDILRNGREIV